MNTATALDHLMPHANRVRELLDTDPAQVAVLLSAAETQRRELRDLVADVHAAITTWRQCGMQPPEGALSAINGRCHLLLAKVPS